MFDFMNNDKLGCRGKSLAEKNDNQLLIKTAKGKASLDIEQAQKLLGCGFFTAKTLQTVSSGEIPLDTALHLAVTQKYSLRLQGALANSIACAANGKDMLKKIIPGALFIDNGQSLREMANSIKSCDANILVFANNGALICAETEAELEERLSVFLTALEKFHGKNTLDIKPKDDEFIFATAPALRSAMAKCGNAASIASSGFFKLPQGVIAPVYHHCSGILEVAEDTKLDDIVNSLDTETYVVVKNKAVFARGCNLDKANDKMLLAREAALAAKLAEGAGGVRYINIDGEKAAACTIKRQKIRGIEGKIALITGGAQGFGFGIAEYLAANGATVAIADMNLAGAEKAVNTINEENNNNNAFALEVNIADEESVEAMTKALVSACGGVDIFVANAGVVRAGSVKEMEKRDWDFVTNINYTGYFLCVKYISRVMALQNKYGNTWTDIVQINSKSGLAGSNRNAAYAGSKFGTIGLTQSFALELVDSNIKVNSICPGNYFDGPLWSDGKNGLFVQYLESGKVPGAKTVEDVKAAYESKIPMGRGCLPSDVAKAIIYCVEQQYETGQAIPVAGAQVMLN